MEENTDYRPLPPPRNNVISNFTKKKPPVPLPRTHINVNSVLKDGSSSTSSTFKDINTLFKKHIKPEIKMASENVLERKKSIIENTRSVSICIEKSFRSLLPRPVRPYTNSQTSEDFKPDVSESPIDNDIFSSLSFDSPIPSDSNSDRSFSNYYSESDFCFSQPPNFPPPPLPQEALYDKIPDSSNSSSQCGSYTTENIYDFIAGPTKVQGYSSYENWNPTSEKNVNTGNTNNVNDKTKYKQFDNYEITPTTQQIQDDEETSNDKSSIVLQFDPLTSLFDKQKEDDETSVLLQEIDEVLRSSHYNTVEYRSVANFNFENPYEDLCVPEPPNRVDSITEFSKPVELSTEDTNNIDFKEDILVDPVITEKPRRNSIKNWFNSLKKVADGSTGSIRKTKSTIKSEEKGEKDNFIGLENFTVFHNGYLYVSINEKNKDFEKKWCQIAGDQFKCTTNKDQFGNSISLSSLLSIQTVDEPKQK